MSPENEVYIIPSENKDMRDFIRKFRIDMYEHIISTIKFAADNKMELIEVFRFKNSPYVITISKKEYDINLSVIEKYYREKQLLELMPRVKALKKQLLA